jgi:hypothetical protein
MTDAVEHRRNGWRSAAGVISTQTISIAAGDSAMKKVRPGRTSAPSAKERSRRGPGRPRWRPELELREGRQTPAVFTVNTALDTVAANLQTGTDAAGHISLRSAIMAANAQPGADTILLPSGIFRLTIAGAGEDAAASGDLDILSDLTIQGRGPNSTIIDGNGLDRVFHVLRGTTSIAQLTIQNGRSDNGGGVLNAGGQVTLSGVVVQDNMAIGADGAAGASGVIGGTPQDLIGKPGQDGGAAAGGGIDNASGSLTLVDSIVRLNQALGGRGGKGADVTGAHGVSSPAPAGSNGQDAIGGDGGVGGHGGAAQGGGVFNATGASLAISGTTLTINLAVGGAGGAGGNALGGRGAGPFGTVPLTDGFGGFARGGAGGTAGAAGGTDGGGLFNGGHLALSGTPNSFFSDQAIGGLGGIGGAGGTGTGGRGGDDPRASGMGGGGSEFGAGGHGGDGGAGGGGIFNAPFAVMTSAGPVSFVADLATGGQGGRGGSGGTGIAGDGGNGGAGSFGSFVANGGAGGQGGAAGLAGGGGLVNAVGARANFTGSPQNLSGETVVLFLGNRTTAGAGGAGGVGGTGQGGFGGNGGSTPTSQGGHGGMGMGGLGGAGSDGGLADGGGFLNNGNLAFTAVTLNMNNNVAIGGAGGTGGNGGNAFGGVGGSGAQGGSGGLAQSGNGGNGGIARGGGGFNPSTGVPLISPRQGAVAGSPQARATSFIQLNQAIGQGPGQGGNAGVAIPGAGGTPEGPIGIVKKGAAGTQGALGLGIGGGLYISSGGSVTLQNTTVSLNHASTSSPDIAGTFSQ